MLLFSTFYANDGSQEIVDHEIACGDSAEACHIKGEEVQAEEHSRDAPSRDLDWEGDHVERGRRVLEDHCEDQAPHYRVVSVEWSHGTGSGTVLEEQEEAAKEH